MIPPTSAGAGVIGTTSAGTGPSLFNGETGVMGLTNAYGVVGRAFMGVMEDDSGAFISATGVVGECRDGVGVHGTATVGLGRSSVNSATSTGVAGRSVSGAGVEGRSEQSIGVEGRTSPRVLLASEASRNAQLVVSSARF